MNKLQVRPLPAGSLASPAQAVGLLSVGVPIVALGYLAAVTLAEVLTSVASPRVGLPIDAVILWALVLQGARTQSAPLRALLWSMTVGPLIRILSLTLPLAGFPIRYWYAIVGVPVFAATFVAARTLGYSRHDLGLVVRPRNLPLDLAMLPVGLALGVVEYLILQPRPLANSLNVAEIWIPALILALATGLEEELVFRGLLQRAAIQSLGLTGGILYVTALFTALHIGYLSAADLAFVFLVGLFFAAITLRTGSILGATLAHTGVNVGLFLIWPFLLPAMLG